MSKGGPIIALGVAAPCAVVGGIYLTKASTALITLPEDLSKFKEGDGGFCVQSLFWGVDKMENSSAKTADSSSNKVNEDLFKDQSSSTPEGCLVINWKKDTYSNNSKGKGNFRFLWAMKRGTKGFITFTKGEVPGTTNKKVKWEGIAYTMKNENNKWTIDKKKEVGANTEMNESDATTKFPTKGESISNVEDGSAFGFIKPSEDASKMCSASDCTGTPQTTSTLQGYGKWKSESDANAKTADKGSKNLSEWGDTLYKNTDGNMQEVVKEVKGSGQTILTKSKPATQGK